MGSVSHNDTNWWAFLFSSEQQHQSAPARLMNNVCRVVQTVTKQRKMGMMRPLPSHLLYFLTSKRCTQTQFLCGSDVRMRDTDSLSELSSIGIIYTATQGSSVHDSKLLRTQSSGVNFMPTQNQSTSFIKYPFHTIEEELTKWHTRSMFANCGRFGE